jgi:2,3-diketo-5-methylthio-1-phosphopentane phosphatase
MQIFCDFDGTISLKDTTDEILSKFALPEWELLEAQWKNGEIGSAECMRRQIALIRASKQQLDSELDAQPIDANFVDFVHFCAGNNLPITIISDGVDYFIKRILGRYNLAHLPVIANHLIVNSDGLYSLSCPHSNPACSKASGVCKCSKLAACNKKIIFVGDGRSDFCATTEADIIFAKHTLAIYCQQHDIDYISYQNFADVKAALKRQLPEFTTNRQQHSQFTVQSEAA